MSKYIWEPTTKYRKICDIIQDRWKYSSEKKLFYRVEYGGFGNQMYTITSLLVLGAISDYMPMYDYSDYDAMFDGCYVDNIISVRQDLGPLNQCTPYTECFPNKDEFWSIQPILNGSTILSAPLMDSAKFFSPENTAKLQSLFGSVISDFTPWNFRRDLMRIWFNPSDSLRREILKEKARLIRRPHMIGLNLRMGGTVANFAESYVGIPYSRLVDVAKQVNYYIDKMGWNPTDVVVYISSDSTKAIQRMTELFSRGIVVVESALYHHGHTGKSNGTGDYIQKMKKVIADMYYMAISEHKFVSWQSSFGRVICFLSDENSCEPVLGWKNTNKMIKIPGWYCL